MKLTAPLRAARFRFAPSSRSADAKEPDGAPEKPQGGSGAPGSGRPQGRSEPAGKVARPERRPRQANRKGSRAGAPPPGRPQGRPTAAGPRGSRKAEPRGPGGRATARRLLGAPEPEGLTVAGSFGSRRAGGLSGSLFLRSFRLVSRCHGNRSHATTRRPSPPRSNRRGGHASLRRARVPRRAGGGHRHRGRRRQGHRLLGLHIEGGSVPGGLPTSRFDASGVAGRTGGDRGAGVLGHPRLVARAYGGARGAGLGGRIGSR